MERYEAKGRIILIQVGLCHVCGFTYTLYWITYQYSADISLRLDNDSNCFS